MFEWARGKVTPKDWAFVGVVLGIAALVLLGYFFGIRTYQMKEIERLQSEVAAVTADLRQARSIAQNIDEFRTEAEKMQTLVRQFEQRLPEEREIPSLLRKFEQRGDELGLRVQLSSLPTVRDARKETIPYKVTAQGNFHQIVSFINLLERDDRYLAISDVDIGEEKNGIAEATFTLSTFRFLQPSEAPADTSAKQGS
jgi:type IV pilus assembly protein PilO